MKKLRAAIARMLIFHRADGTVNGAEEETVKAVRTTSPVVLTVNSLIQQLLQGQIVQGRTLPRLAVATCIDLVDKPTHIRRRLVDWDSQVAAAKASRVAGPDHWDGFVRGGLRQARDRCGDRGSRSSDPWCGDGLDRRDGDDHPGRRDSAS